MGDRPLGVLFAPDSFKGTFTSIQVARALADGWGRARPSDRCVLAPLADGGEGTLVAIEAAGGWRREEAAAHDPLGRPIRVPWLRSSDGRRAFVELAAASGLSRLAPAEREAGRTSTRGTGEVLRAILDAGVRRVTLGLGGSATTDGGSGILRALGVRVLDAGGGEVAEGGDTLAAIARVDLEGLDRRLAGIELRIACDVDNPLLGPRGAAAVYGPQKGANPSDVTRLDAALGHWADVLESETGRRVRDVAGAGAAGGASFGLLAIADRLGSVALVPGIDVVTDEIDLAGKLGSADVVVTGEGRIDEQTAYGKTALGVARRAREAGIACVAVGGGVVPAGIEALRAFGAVVVPVVERPTSFEEQVAEGTGPIERCGERLAELVSIGLRQGGRE